MARAKSIAVNTVLNTIRMSLTILIPLLTYPYITRIFGADGVGKYEWVKSVVSIFTLIASMGIATYAVREGSKVRDDRAKFSKFAQELFILNVCATAVCYLTLFTLIQFVPKFSLYRTYLYIYSINIGLSALSMDWVYSVYEDYLYITVRQILVQIASLVGLFLLVHTKDDLINYIIITTVSNSGANIFNFLRSKKYIDFKVLPRYELLIHLGPVLIFFGTRFAMNAYNSLDTVILGLLSSDNAVGYYNVAVKTNTILVTFFTAMSPVYLPRMMSYLTKGESGQYKNLLTKAVHLKTILIYPMACGLFILAPQIVWLIAGDGFVNAISTLRILSFVLVFVLLSSIVQKDIMIPLGDEKEVLKLTLCGAIANVAISSILILLIGYNGAAWGSLLSEGVIFIAGGVKVKKHGIKLFKLLVNSSSKYAIATILMGVWCLFVQHKMLPNISVILICIPSAVILYGAVIVFLKDQFFCDNAKVLLRKILRR